MLVLQPSALHCLNQTAFVVLRSGRLCYHRCFLVETDSYFMNGRRFLGWKGDLLTVVSKDIL